MAQLEEAFSLFDKDGDGTISIYEIEIVMKVRVRRTEILSPSKHGSWIPRKAFGGNPTHEEIEEHLKTIDLDGDGTVDYPEFLSWVKTPR